jgi:BirA family biotin operon repressor/biotin-[acetyl-CoA-carboxylase] ligase
MKFLKIKNPFDAPVYHEETTGSTMNISRRLASEGAESGTVIAADFQEAGRGRIQGRFWRMEKEKNLPFTVMLRYSRIEDIPAALTLRTGLAVTLAIEDFAPVLRAKVLVKWPNDIIIGGKKAAGILCEGDGTVHIGIGINFAQKDFPTELREKATSIALSAGSDFSPEQRFVLLEKILSRLYEELNGAKDWKGRLEQRLYKKDEQVVFIEGAAGSGKEVRGRLTGIGEGGELLIVPQGEGEARAFITGELIVF